LLLSQTDPSDSPLNSIFMLGGAPKAHDAYSKGDALFYTVSPLYSLTLSC